MELIEERKSLKLLNTALALGVFTISYNVLEGLISTYFGYRDETLTLFGFGVDSFVEVVSGIGIVHMVWRMKNHPVENRDRFEARALRITGSAFYVLTLGLVIGAVINIVEAAQPQSTLFGIIISLVSILTMYVLYHYKLKTGKELDSAPIISDAHCTKTCFYLSFILLSSSLLYQWVKIPYIDAIGSLGIAWYAFKEGREAFEKAKIRSY